MNPLYRIAVTTVLCVLVSGCASTAAGITKGILDKFLEPGFTSIEAELEAAQGLNPDPYGDPRPLVFRTYWLSSTSTFESADYQSLYFKGEDTLGQDLLASEEFRIAPGETRTEVRTLTKKLEEGAIVYLGVLGAYRDNKNARWRASMPLELHEENQIRIRFEELGVVLEPAKE